MSREWMSLGFECLKPGDIHGFLCNAAMQAVGGALRLLGGAIQQTQRVVRSVEQAVQEVVEVLQPGPLGGTAARWDAHRRAEADLAVQQALSNWRQLQSRQQHAVTKAQMQHPQQH